MWALPRPEVEPLSPALAGGLLSTGSPGKSHLNTVQGHQAHSHSRASISASVSRRLSPSQLDPLSSLVAHAPPPAPGPHLLFSVSMHLAPEGPPVSGSHGVCPAVLGSFHRAQRPPGSSTLQPVSELPSFLRLNNIPSNVFATHCSSLCGHLGCFRV